MIIREYVGGGINWKIGIDIYMLLYVKYGLPRWLGGKESACQCKRGRGTWVWSLSHEDPLEGEMATHSSILAWKIPEEPGRLQFMGLQRAGHNWVREHSSVISVAQSCPSLCDPMDGSIPGFPVHHQLLKEPTQTLVRHVRDAIQPSHPLSFPIPPAFNLSQHQGLFKWVGSSHQVAEVLEFQLQHQSFQWTFKTDLL